MKRAAKIKQFQQQEHAEHVERLERVAAPLPDGRSLTLDVRWRGERIAGLRLGLAEKGAKARNEAPQDGAPSEAARLVRAGMERLIMGLPADFSGLPLDWDQLTPFTRAVLETLADRVPCGSTVTYGQLAELSGQPGKARAVGGAMARNPWPLVVPCHRVLGAGGGLTGYTNPHGLDLKALLLRLEGAAG